MDARVDILIVQHDIARLRYAGKKSTVGVKARIEKKRGRSVMERGDSVLEGLGVDGVPVEQARAGAAQTEGMAGGEGGESANIGLVQRGRR
jgi:hypothetical protein